jgi:peptidyl-prolyl cis-trans isomerase D
VLIRVTSHAPERTQPLAQVRDRVIAAVRADRTAKAAAKDADALLARLRAGETLEAIAASRNLPAPQHIPAVPRGAPVIDPSVSEVVLAAPAPAAGKIAPGKTVLPSGQVVLFAVTSVTPGNMAELPPAQRAMLQQQLEQVGGMSDVQTLVQALRKRMKIKVVEANL